MALRSAFVAIVVGSFLPTSFVTSAAPHATSTHSDSTNLSLEGVQFYGPFENDTLRVRLLVAARDSTLQSWQRDELLRLAEARPPRREPRIDNATGTIADGQWKQIFPASPLARDGVAGAYDPSRDQFIYFGGYDRYSYTNETWRLTLNPTPKWTRLAPPGAKPAGRNWHGAVYDPQGDRVIIFGGWDAQTMFDDVWEFNLPTNAWSEMHPFGSPPSARIGHTMMFDADHRQVLIVGGTDLINEKNDVWALALNGDATWVRLRAATDVPIERSTHSAVYDSTRDRMVVFGGIDTGNHATADAWAFDFQRGRWFSPPIVGGINTHIGLHSAVYDSRRGRMLVFGGLVDLSSLATNLVWSVTTGDTLYASPLAVHCCGPVPEARYGHHAIYDPVTDAMLVFGGIGAFGLLDNRVYSLSLSTNTWTLINWPAPAPSPRAYGAVTLDSRRHRLLLFGGWNGDMLNDLWEFSFETLAWNLLSTGQAPSPAGRDGASALYDLDGDRLLIFGGNTGPSRLNDVWAFSFETNQWSQLDVAGTRPLPRFFSAGFRDARNRWVLFGGQAQDPRGDPRVNDLWSMSLNAPETWSEIRLFEDVPEPRAFHAAAFDPVDRKVVVFGGWSHDRGFKNDTWRLAVDDTAAWERIEVSKGPSPRDGMTALYDASLQALAIFGGNDDSFRLNESWWLSLRGTPEWHRAPDSTPAPSPRFNHSTVYDSQRGEMVLFAGEDWTQVGDAWSTSLGTTRAWYQLSETVTWPDGDFYNTAIVDERRNRVLLFGGYDWTVGHVYVADLVDLTKWRPLEAFGVPPNQRASSVAYDPDGDRVIIYGGERSHISTSRMWELALSDPPTWTELAQLGDMPDGRDQGNLTFDPSHHRMLLYGGDRDFDFRFGDLWQLGLESPLRWSELTQGNGPGARSGNTFLLEPTGDRVLVIGGENYDTPQQGLVWELSLDDEPQWQRIAPEGMGPQWFSRGSSIIDPTSNRAILFGGLVPGMWSLSLGDAPMWQPQEPAGGPPRGYFKAAACFDPVGKRMLVFGGSDGTISNELWALEWNQPTTGADIEGPSLQLALHGLDPNPAAGDLHVAFTLASAAPAQLAMLDVMGRVVASEAFVGLGPGAHRVRLTRPASLKSGVYWLRLSQAGEVKTVRAVVIR
jgi:Galactose oxidase, central domain